MLFSDQLQNYLWSYDNNGLRLAQVRFYEVSTNTNQGSADDFCNRGGATYH